MARVALMLQGLALAATLPLDAKIGRDVAQWMNHLYTGFDKNDDESPLGVTISMQNTWALYCGTGCYGGHADCRLSASLYNNQMMLDRQTEAIKLTFGRVAGIVINQTLVESSMGKCSYMFDGSTYNRYNGGCGCSSNKFGCTNPQSAFGNKCPSTNKICTTEDEEVAQCSCEAKGISTGSGPGSSCFFKGAGFDTTQVQHTSDQTRQMVKERLKHQQRSDYWNEIVVDEHLMLQQLREDPVPVIPAFIYDNSNPAGLDFARKMRDDYVLQFSVKKQIPLIAVDSKKKHASGPFSYEDVEQVQETLLI